MTVAPFAQWRGPVPNKTPGGMHLPSLGLVLHVMESSLAAADGWFHNPSAKASAHFGVDFDGTIVQWVEWEDKAWAEVAGNPSYHSVETSGYNDQPLTDAQLRGVATIYAEGMRRYGWPAQLANVPGEQGLGTHAMGGSAWGGHTACPGPQRTAQRATILQLAGGTPAPTPEEEDVTYIVSAPGETGQLVIISGQVFVLDSPTSADAFAGAGAKNITVTKAMFDQLLASGR